MTMSRKIWTSLLVGIGLLMCLPGISMSAEKVDEVVVGLNLELTGGLASATMPPCVAMLDYYNYVNEQGGFTYTDPVSKKLRRAKYKILWADNGFSIARALTNGKRFIDAGAKLILSG